MSVLVKGTAYGREEVMEESMGLLEFLINHTPRKLAEKYILRITGPIIRVSNYPLLMRQKIRIMELLINIFKAGFKIDAYRNQIMSVCLRLLQEFKHNNEIMHIVADTYYALLSHSVLKKEIILPLFAKLKTFGGNLMQTIYYLVKKIVKDGLELPKTLF